MSGSENNWVPKVHPLTRELATEDPMELVATPVQGDPDTMFECLVQEFAWMGMDAEQLFRLFQSPDYPLLGMLLEHYGAVEVQRRIQQVLARSGVLNVRATVVEEPDDYEDEQVEFVPLGLDRLGATARGADDHQSPCSVA